MNGDTESVYLEPYRVYIVTIAALGALADHLLIVVVALYGLCTSRARHQTHLE